MALLAAGFAIHPAAGILAFVSAAAFGAAFLYLPDPGIKHCSDIRMIDLVLHNADHLFVSERLRKANYPFCKARSPR